MAPDPHPAVTRAALHTAIDHAVERAEARPRGYRGKYRASAAALHDVIEHAEEVALGAYCVGDCGCPMVQAGLANRFGSAVIGLYGGDIDDALVTAGAIDASHTGGNSGMIHRVVDD